MYLLLLKYLILKLQGLVQAIAWNTDLKAISIYNTYTHVCRKIVATCLCLLIPRYIKLQQSYAGSLLFRPVKYFRSKIKWNFGACRETHAGSLHNCCIFFLGLHSALLQLLCKLRKRQVHGPISIMYLKHLFLTLNVDNGLKIIQAI